MSVVTPMRDDPAQGQHVAPGEGQPTQPGSRGESSQQAGEGQPGSRGEWSQQGGSTK